MKGESIEIVRRGFEASYQEQRDAFAAAGVRP